MNEQMMYAVDMRGRPLAALRLAEGADVVDALLFAFKNVPGAHDVTAHPTSLVSPLEESEARIDAATRELTGLPPRPAPKHEARDRPVPGSIEESEARIDDALSGMDGNAAAARRCAARLPVHTVTRQEGRPLSEGTRTAATTPAPRRNGAGPLVELREVPRPATSRGYVDYGGGRTEVAEFNESGQLVKIGGRIVR
jgi:hypothetical protein